MNPVDAEELSRPQRKRRLLGLALLLFMMVCAWVIHEFGGDPERVEFSRESTQAEDTEREFEDNLPRRFQPSTEPAILEGDEEPEAAEAPEEPESEGREVVLSKGPFRGLFGVVLDPQGHRVPHADVSLFLVEERKTLACTSAFDTGRFYLKTNDVPSCSAVLTAQAPGFQPFSKRMEVYPSVDERELVLQLEEGHELSGVVRVNGKPCSASLSVDLAYGKPGLFGAGHEVFQRDGRIVAKHGNARTDAKGHFRITGLADHSYQLSVHLNYSEFVCLPYSVMRKVQVPNSDYQLDLEFVTRTFEVRSQGEFRKDATVMVRCQNSHHNRDGRGAITVGLIAGESYSACAVETGFEPTEVSFQAPPSNAAGPFVIELKRLPSRSLVIDWVGAYEAGVRALHVSLEPVQMEATAKAFSSWENWAILRANMGHLDMETAEPCSRYCWEGFPYPPGRYRLKIEPRRIGKAPRNIMALATETIIDVPESGDIYCNLVCESGGLLRFTTKARPGLCPWGNWELRDTEGKGFGRGFFDLSSGADSLSQPFLNIIPPGDYILKLETEGNEIKTYHIQMPATAVLDFDIDLDCPTRPKDLGPFLRLHTLGGVGYFRIEHGAAMMGGPQSF